ncbi:MAG: EAL domain-containing protein [Cyanobacteria bacterium]|nr:EAL domain-containing protein [Cyanobacteriota bacterium]MDA0865923.1 EAL domain-containing protein [Cyanobacteriota bacterium]
MSSEIQKNGCGCTSGIRKLVILAQNLGQSFPELLSFSRHAGWNFYPELEALEIMIGNEEKPTDSLVELINFFRGILDDSRLNALRGVWVKSGEAIQDQLVTLIHAGRLVDMAPHDSSDLLDILYHKRIETWFQPVYRVNGEQPWGYECLMRGRNNDGNIISPFELLQWAKQENLIFMLDRICRETHLLNAGAKIPNLEETQVLINFLPSSIYRPEFCLRSTCAAAERAGLQPGNIIFEVIETEHISDIDHLKLILSSYRQLGFKVALDDIGSAFSGLNLLGGLDPDLIKIDRQLIENARDSELHGKICSALVDIGRSRGKQVLAEGIETQEDHDFALSLDVDLVQGYFYGRPSPEPKG